MVNIDPIRIFWNAVYQINLKYPFNAMQFVIIYKLIYYLLDHLT